MNKLSGSNLSGHSLIVFMNTIYLIDHPGLSIQERIDSLFNLYSEIEGHYLNRECKADLEILGSIFEEIQGDCINKIDSEDYANSIINAHRIELMRIQRKLKRIISDLEILKDVRYGMPSEEEI